MASITKEDAREIAALQKTEGRQELRSRLGWAEFDEEDDLQTSILLDYLYDHLQFAIQRGLPWQQACDLLQMAWDVLQETKGKSLPESIKIYAMKCAACSKKISEKYLKLYTDFFFLTYFRHFKLYQYVMNQDQDKLTIKYALPVEIPPSVSDFKDSKSIKVWEYERKIEEIEVKTEKRKEERGQEDLERKNKHLEMLNSSMNEIKGSEKGIEREQMKQLITEVAGRHLSSASESLQASIQATLEDLEFMLEKTSLPRPPELDA